MLGNIRLWSYALIVALTFVFGSNAMGAQADADAKGKKSKAAEDKQKKEKPGNAGKAEARGQSQAKKIDLNSATKEELETLQGVGPATADAIIAARPFKNVQELKEVPGIGEVRWGEIRRDVTVRQPKASVKRERKEVRTTKSEPPVRSERANRAPVGAPAGSERSERPVVEQPKNRPAPLPSDSRTTTSRRSSDSAKVNINTASQEDLEALLGIGPVKAQAIIDNRPYKSVDDVMEVKGIKEGTFEQIRDRITVR